MPIDEKDGGYGRPPKKSRFKKGVSGNPKGRRPKSRNTVTILFNELESIITIGEGDTKLRLTKREALIKSLVNDAIKGKNQARALLLRILEVDNPPEPFSKTMDDEAVLDDYVKRQKDGSDESPADEQQ